MAHSCCTHCSRLMSLRASVLSSVLLYTRVQTHFLVIPKARGNLASLSGARPGDEAVLGHLLFVAGQVAKQEGLERGFRIVINDGE